MKACRFLSIPEPKHRAKFKALDGVCISEQKLLGKQFSTNFYRHRVAGWIIRSVTASDTSNSDHTLGDLIFEIKFEREDTGQASMDQVMMHPLVSEIDDYAEYKRLRRLQRETMRHKGGSLQSELELGEIEMGMNAPSTAGGSSAVDLTSALGTAN
jgi:hypothetical protein